MCAVLCCIVLCCVCGVSLQYLFLIEHGQRRHHGESGRVVV